MRYTTLKKLSSCLKFIQFFICLGCISLVQANSRFPASSVPQDNIEAAPLGTVESWYEKVVVEDRKGVMVSTRDNLNSWQEVEQFRDTWGIDFTGIYVTPDDSYKKSYVQKQLIRYLDKRLTGELKHAKQGSALHRVNAVQNALKPNAEASISKNIKLKFKAQVLQGEGTISVVNPWVDCNARVNLQGNVEMHLEKKFESLRINTVVDYRKNDDIYITSIERQLSDTVTTRVTSTQISTEVPFSTNSDARLGVFYHKPF